MTTSQAAKGLSLQWKMLIGFLVGLAADITPKKLLEEALALMEPDKVLGLVFNGYKPVGNDYGGYY